MTLHETLQKASSEEDVKAAYIKALGLKDVRRNLIDIQTKEVWFEAKHSSPRNVFMSTLDQADVDVMTASKTCRAATRFQYDYLNDDIADDGTIDYSITNKMPPALREIIAAARAGRAPYQCDARAAVSSKPPYPCDAGRAVAPRYQCDARAAVSSKPPYPCDAGRAVAPRPPQQKILILQNPPYAEATNASNTAKGAKVENKAGVAKTRWAKSARRDQRGTKWSDGAMEKVVAHTWLNDRDQFLIPDKELSEEFKLDCLVYMLFHNSNLTASADGLEWNGRKWSIVNHFIPFTEEEVDAPGRFESDFMVRYLGKHTDWLTPNAVLK